MNVFEDCAGLEKFFCILSILFLQKLLFPLVFQILTSAKMTSTMGVVSMSVSTFQATTGVHATMGSC